MKIWKRRAAGQETAAGPVQLRGGERHPFVLLDGYVPLHEPAFGLYRAIREAVPVVDAAVLKLVRLAGGVHVTCADKGLEKRLAEFLRTVPVGWNQVGLQAFLDSYAGDTVCSKQLYKEALNHAFDEPKQWEIREINEIMNQCVTGWTYFSNPRSFAGYGRQKGWERERSATDSDNHAAEIPDGFVEITEQIEMPF